MSEGIKRAALALSALDKGDRDWILENLDQAERDRLEGALAEVDEIGAQVSERDMTALFENTAMPNPAQTPANGSPIDGRQRVIQAEAADMLRVLGAEPDWMVAAVCGMWQWRWLPDFLPMLGIDRAERVGRYMRTQPDHSPAVLDALTEVLDKRLALGEGSPMFDLRAERPAQVLRTRGRLAASFSRLTSWLL